MRTRVGALVAIGLSFGCSPRERAPAYGSLPTKTVDEGGGGAAGASSLGHFPAPDSGDISLGDTCEGPPDPDTSKLCGNQVVPVLIEKPNLYFVVDSSGSMVESIDSKLTQTKLSAVQDALIEVTSELGHRVSYGLAAFPGADGGNALLLGCGPGVELFPTQEGDPLECLNRRGGEVHDAFSAVVGKLTAAGGTSLSSTLDALTPTLLALKGQTAVVLLTDGAPNCNPDAQCEASACIPNIEGGSLPSGLCNDDFNCCDSSQVDEIDLPYIGVPEAACVDGPASLDAVAKFRDAGLMTFVIGVPGSEPYADLMTSLAEAGGTLRGTGPGYYDVRDVSGLLTALTKIGAEITQGCEVTLQSPPADVGLLNVYFDDALLEQGETDGWTLQGDLVTFHGVACDQLSGGQVAQLQLVSGCQTVIR